MLNVLYQMFLFLMFNKVHLFNKITHGIGNAYMGINITYKK